MKNNKGIKIIIVIASIILLCVTITGTTILITGCSKGKTVNNIENSSTSSVCDNTTTSTDTTKDNVKETTNKETDTSKESDNETTMEETETDTTEVNTTTEEVTTQSPTKAPQPTTVAPTQAPTKAPQATTSAPTKAPQPTTVAPTQAPTKAPQPTTVAPTEEPTTAPVIHGANGRILDTIYFHYPEASSNPPVWKVPETREEFIEVVKDGDINDDTISKGGSVIFPKYVEMDFFGIGFIFGKTTMDEIKEYYGEPVYVKVYPDATILYYEYKCEDLMLTFTFLNEDKTWYFTEIKLREDAEDEYYDRIQYG